MDYLSDAEAITIGIIIAVFYLALFVFGIINYIFFSRSLYAIGKNRGIKNYGLAWVPLIRNWLIGAITDKFDLEKSGREYKWRKVLLWLTIVVLLGFVLCFTFVGIAIKNGIENPDGINETALFCALFSTMLPAEIVAIAMTICSWICYFKIFESCNPDKPVKYLLISMLVPFAFPFVFNRCRKLEKVQYLLQPELPEAGMEVLEEQACRDDSNKLT